MTHRFFVAPTDINGRNVVLTGDVAHQISRVLRMSPEEEVVLLDNTGKEYGVRLNRISRDTVEGEVLSTVEGQGEPALEITLHQGILKGEKFEWVLQKGTELGVARFVPIICRRSIPRRRDDPGGARYARWRRIVTEAAEQSRRSRLPEICLPTAFEEACDLTSGQDTSIIPWEMEEGTGLRRTLEGTASRRVNVFIGPEGGFDEAEVAYASSRGVVQVSLGKRILRAETAAVAAVATVTAVLYEAGEMGQQGSSARGPDA